MELSEVFKQIKGEEKPSTNTKQNKGRCDLTARTHPVANVSTCKEELKKIISSEDNNNENLQ